MAPIFRRPAQVICFFCNEEVNPAPRNPQQFRCPHCSSWNRYNAAGEIDSDEPAMHEESLNSKSFARRASPRKDRLPTVFPAQKSLFCHTCQTNQMLITNMLANYLPDSEDPSYPHRLETLPEYEASLQTRYPPVCSQCAPLVEDEIKRRDDMARTSALGGWLKTTKGKDTQRRRQVSGGARRKHVSPVKDLRAWQLRGCLWVGSVASAIAVDMCGAFQQSCVPRHAILTSCLPWLVLLSVFWTFWDPTYAAVQRAHMQGRDVRVRGRKNYIVLQTVVWLLRLCGSIVSALPAGAFASFAKPSYTPRQNWTLQRIYLSLCLISELAILLVSFSSLRVQYPPKIRLLDADGSRRSVAPSSRAGTPFPRDIGAVPEMLAPLSLSAHPVMPAPEPANPIFGESSLLTKRTPMTSHSSMNEDEEDPFAMDVDIPSPQKRSFRPDNALGTEGDVSGSWLRPQRFFPPEKPTGLESLLERTGLSDRPVASANVNGGDGRFRKWILISLCLPLTAAIVMTANRVMRIPAVPAEGHASGPVNGDPSLHIDTLASGSSLH